MKKQIVLSGVGLTTMGPLAVFRDALSSIASEYGREFDITALVHTQASFDIPDVTYLEFPGVKRSWLKRLNFEYRLSKHISDSIKPVLWLSMDNITPNVSAEIQALYCHNPSPFYPFHLTDLWLDWKFGLFTLFFRYLYGINIHRNDYVIVQQDWIRRSFQRSYSVTNVIVAHPTVDLLPESPQAHPQQARSAYRFFYPAFPRPFKNAEIALEAASILEAHGQLDFELWLTFDENVNRYAARMARKFRHLRSVRWLGLLQRQQVFQRYKEADCLLFASKLETWGLPITEFKATGKPIIAADLPYAHETVGSYGQVAFFEARDAPKLASLMEAAILRIPEFSRVQAAEICQPFANDWQELWSLILPASVRASIEPSQRACCEPVSAYRHTRPARSIRNGAPDPQ